MANEEAGLQAVLRHAGRLAELLFVHELTPPGANEAAALWLIGRAAEVERYVESVFDDQAAGRLDTAAARATLEQYVGSLHAGLATLVGEASPSCCHPPTPRRRPRRR